VAGDFCHEAHSNVLAVATTRNDTTYRNLEYYLNCAKDFTPEQRIDRYPFRNTKADLASLFDDITEEVTKAGDSSCPTWANTTATIKQAEMILLGPGGIVSPDGILGCFAANERVELLLTTLCHDFYDPFALLYELFFSFAFLLCCSEVLQKCLRVEDSSIGDDCADPEFGTPKAVAAAGTADTAVPNSAYGGDQQQPGDLGAFVATGV